MLKGGLRYVVFVHVHVHVHGWIVVLFGCMMYGSRSTPLLPGCDMILQQGGSVEKTLGLFARQEMWVFEFAVFGGTRGSDMG